MASNERGSKLANVIMDLLGNGARFKMNQFTVFLLRMMTADSVNILKNIKEVELEPEEKEKPKHPWKSVQQTKEMNGGDGGDEKPTNFDKLEKSFPEALPRIVEIGFHCTNFLLGVRVVYSDGTVAEAKGNSGDPSTYKCLKL